MQPIAILWTDSDFDVKVVTKFKHSTFKLVKYYINVSEWEIIWVCDER